LFDDLNDDGMDVNELLVATPDHGDLGLEACVHDTLRLVREKTALDTAFVRATRPDGRRDLVVGGLDASQQLEAAWGEHLLGQHLSEGDAARCIHQNASVVLADGSVYGSLCVCSRDQWTAQTDLKLLRSTAMLVAQKIDQGRRPLLAGHRPRWGDLRAAAGARPRFDGETTRP
jgi:hypothetical protein